jgi:UDP-N-acetylglucosamine acyltransferase
MNNVAVSGIHATAIVSSEAQIADDVTVGPNTIIEGNVTIGAGTQIGANVLVGSGARIGANVQIHHGAVVSSLPQDLKFGGEATTLSVGDNTVIREYATLNRGTVDRGETRVGANCLLMAYSHVAHDCLIGDNVILANSVNLAGHITIEDFVIIGGIVPVHQFTRIGCHAMIGGGFRVPQDICPYSLAGGYPLRITGLNLVGLRRREFSRESIKTLQHAFKLLFKSELNTTQAVERITAEVPESAEVTHLLEFIAGSSRGINK